MKIKQPFKIALIIALLIPAVSIVFMSMTEVELSEIPARPEGPCDIYAEDGCPCVAAHSSTRALYASYDGPLYQVMRKSDGKTLDIGVVQPSEGDPGGYADAAAQDEFCKDTYCWITKLYDQSGMKNHLEQAPRGAFIGPAMGGFNNVPMADMAPVTLMGRKVYGIFIAPDMGLRWNDPRGTAVDDQAEGQYWVINGHHFNDGCCFNYGNVETDSRDDGDGTMESTYYGNARFWYYGQDDGPWIMTDQENNLVGCVNPDPNDKYCDGLPSISWRFVTATADGKPGHWRSMGGDAQGGELYTMYDGGRIINEKFAGNKSSYDPMRKQGAIVLGNGGDNNNYSQGTFYEAAMTAAGTYPSAETNQRIQANIVKAGYAVAQVSIAPSSALDTPPGLQTFAPNTSQSTTVTYTNTSQTAVNNLELSIDVPKNWEAVVLGTNQRVQKFATPIQPGETVSAVFNVKSGSETLNGDIIGLAKWTNGVNGMTQTESAIEKVRNVNPVKINEFAIGSGENLTNTFIELYNASESEIDISNWSLTQHQAELPIFSSIKVPAGTELGANDFYLLGLSTSGLAVPAASGESTIYVRSTTGMSVGDEIEIGSGPTKETRKITSISKAPKRVESEVPTSFMANYGYRQPLTPGTPTTVWQPLPEGPVITIPKGSTSIPVESVDNFEVGQKMAIGYGATYPAVARDIEKYEVVTVTKVGKRGTQAWLSVDAKAGDTNIKVSSVKDITVGDSIRLDIDSKGHGIEWVTVKKVGTASSRNSFGGPLTKEGDDPGTGLELTAPLKFDHAYNMPFSVWGTGISFEPPTKFEHSSNEPVLPLCFAIKLDKPLVKSHEINDVVIDAKVTTAGYQGTAQPDQWFGGPALSFVAGNMVLRDANGNVVDGLNYGEIVDPWASEGYHAISGAGELGCYTESPAQSGGTSRRTTQPTTLPLRSTGRYPDGTDNDSNCNDFKLHNTITLTLPVKAGANNVKVNSVDDFRIGQKVVVGIDKSETAIITLLGSPGGTLLSAQVKAGDTIIPVENIEGFSPGQTITIGKGASQETVVLESATDFRRFWWRPRNDDGPTTFVTLKTPIKKQHGVGEEASGSGLTFSRPLSNSYEEGAQVSSGVPTPGEPNQYVVY
ncbi:arabinofuranosidase catalytic domain-containing protein [Flagellimonas sp. GZD32]|uniref:arabinofuranosidase catalytic domain-containing protein n=1 Tax=Flagellimonas cixiensis TaxID=3228750 RepID=UPI0035C8E031